MPSYTRFKGIHEVSESTLTDQIRSNVIEFFNWGMLCIGAFNNVQAGSSSAPYGGGDFSRLAPVQDPNYQDGQVWQGFRQNWVWESGVEYVIQPIQVSGVWINSVFYNSNTTGTYAHRVNYPLGQVVFSNPIPYDTGTVVRASYSYRLYSLISSDANWFRQVMFESYRVDSPEFLQYGSGVWNTLAQNRVQFPVVVVDVPANRSITGFELGGTSNIKQEIRFFIYTETPWDRDFLVDTITIQKDHTIPFFDKNKVIEANAYPLNYQGAIASGALTFPNLVKPTRQGGFYWRGATFLEMRAQETISGPPLFQALVRSTLELNILFT